MAEQSPGYRGGLHFWLGIRKLFSHASLPGLNLTVCPAYPLNYREFGLIQTVLLSSFFHELTGFGDYEHVSLSCSGSYD